MSAPGARPPFHQRLVFRFGVIMVVTLVLFDLVSHPIHDVVFRLFDIPSTMVVQTEVGSAAFGGFDPDETGPAELPEMLGGLPLDFEGLGRVLLEGAEPIAAAHLAPTPAAIAATAERFGDLGLDFVWTTGALRPVASSDPGRFEGVARLGRDDVPPFALWHPVDRGGEPAELAGWLAIWPRGLAGFEGEPGATGSFPDLTFAPFGPEADVKVVEPEEMQTISRRIRLLASGASFGLSLLAALVLGLALSRLVTARLDRLTAAAAELGTESSEVGQPTPSLPTGGRDEIALLSRVLSSSRERIAELLATLQARDCSRREWIAHVSHDLRTPLTALMACIDRAEEVLGEGGSGATELRRILATARHDGERVSELADDLLSIARLDAEGGLEPEPLLLAELANGAFVALRPIAEARGVELELDLGPGPCAQLTFMGHGKGILRVLENLLRNAIDHAGSSVVLRVRRLENAPDEGDRLEFEILDDGPGFTHRAATRERSEGGIGLRVARRFVEVHGGRLETGDWERGGRAAFRLPVGELP